MILLMDKAGSLSIQYESAVSFFFLMKKVFTFILQKTIQEHVFLALKWPKKLFSAYQVLTKKATKVYI